MSEVILIDSDDRFSTLYQALEQREGRIYVLVNPSGQRALNIGVPEFANFRFLSDFLSPEFSQANGFQVAIDKLSALASSTENGINRKAIKLISTLSGSAHRFDMLLSSLECLAKEHHLAGYLTIDDCNPYFGFVARYVKQLGVPVVCYLHGSLYSTMYMGREHSAQYYFVHAPFAKSELMRGNVATSDRIYITGNLAYEGAFPPIAKSTCATATIRLGVALSHFDDQDDEVVQIATINQILQSASHANALPHAKKIELYFKVHPHGRLPAASLVNLGISFVHICETKEHLFGLVDVLLVTDTSSICAEAAHFRIPAFCIVAKKASRIVSPFDAKGSVFNLFDSDITRLLFDMVESPSSTGLSAIGEDRYAHTVDQLLGPTSGNVARMIEKLNVIFSDGATA